MSRRHEWKFPYPADKLFEAATAKKSFHQGRLDWWSNKRDEVKREIQEKGINIEESVTHQDAFYAASGSNSVRRVPTVSLDSKLVNDLNECLNKVSEHSAKVGDYNTWMQVLASQGQASFDLNQSDWMFFFGK